MTKNGHFPEKGRMATLPGQRGAPRRQQEMRRNETELKVSPLLATPDEANQGRLAHRVRVSGVPNEATVASFSASPLGVNEAKQGQIGPGFTPLSFPCRRHHPLALWERARVRATRKMSGNERNLKVCRSYGLLCVLDTHPCAWLPFVVIEEEDRVSESTGGRA